MTAREHLPNRRPSESFTLEVARLVERLLAEVSCAGDRLELFDLGRHATESIAALPPPHREQLGERIADAVHEWLEANEIRHEDE